jgi:hypothetical protein
MFSPETLLERFPNGVRLREDAQVWEDERGLRVVAQRSMTIADYQPADQMLIDALRVGLPAAQVKAIRPGSRTSRVLEGLNRIGGLRHPHVGHKVDQRFDRQSDWLSYFLADPSSVEERIENARILILGCGGTGALIAQHLARSGFRHFVLVDGAKVDSPDLNRQLPYSEQSVGSDKAMELRRFLIEHEGVRSVEARVLRIDIAAIATQVARDAQPDFIVSAMDQPIGQISPWIAEAAAEIGVPVIFGGVGIEDATVGPLLVTPDTCRAFAKEMAIAGAKVKVSGRIPKASIVFTNTIVAAQLAFEVFRYFTGTELPIALNRTLNLSFPSLALTERARWQTV